jgi:hypothetical protein
MQMSLTSGSSAAFGLSAFGSAALGWSALARLALGLRRLGLGLGGLLGLRLLDRGGRLGLRLLGDGLGLGRRGGGGVTGVELVEAAGAVVAVDEEVDDDGAADAAEAVGPGWEPDRTSAPDPAAAPSWPSACSTPAPRPMASMPAPPRAAARRRRPPGVRSCSG